jgi:hypothetical protein
VTYNPRCAILSNSAEKKENLRIGKCKSTNTTLKKPPEQYFNLFQVEKNGEMDGIGKITGAQKKPFCDDSVKAAMRLLHLFASA